MARVGGDLACRPPQQSEQRSRADDVVLEAANDLFLCLALGDGVVAQSLANARCIGVGRLVGIDTDHDHWGHLALYLAEALQATDVVLTGML